MEAQRTMKRKVAGQFTEKESRYCGAFPVKQMTGHDLPRSGVGLVTRLLS